MKDRLIKVFLNEDERRLRAGWRIALFVPIVMALAFGFQTLIKATLGGLPQDPTEKMFAQLVMAATVGTLATLIARRFLDKRTFVSLGLTLDLHAIKDWIFGFVLSAAMAGVVFSIHLATGLMDFQGVNPEISTSAFLADFGLMIMSYVVLVAFWEELVFRGYLLQNMIDGMGKLWAVILSCLLYGVVHHFNPNAGLLSSAIIVLFGYLRLYGYLETSQLWLSMGMHAAWNFFQGPVLGYSASGYETRTILLHQPVGPTWLTGGEFGPEGSVITIPVVLLALVAMRWWSSGRPKVQ
jgi:membrane protease YdiL (CAAX protease family)